MSGLKGGTPSSIKGGQKRINIAINLWHHMDFVNIHLDTCFCVANRSLLHRLNTNDLITLAIEN